MELTSCYQTFLDPKFSPMEQFAPEQECSLEREEHLCQMAKVTGQLSEQKLH